MDDEADLAVAQAPVAHFADGAGPADELRLHHCPVRAAADHGRLVQLDPLRLNRNGDDGGFGVEEGAQLVDCVLPCAYNFRAEVLKAFWCRSTVVVVGSC